MSYELDEIVPVSRWREGGYSSPQQCALDPRNVRPAHRLCNQKRGNGKNRKKKPVQVKPIYKHSREW